MALLGLRLTQRGHLLRLAAEDAPILEAKRRNGLRRRSPKAPARGLVQLGAVLDW